MKWKARKEKTDSSICLGDLRERDPTRLVPPPISNGAKKRRRNDAARSRRGGDSGSVWTEADVLADLGGTAGGGTVAGTSTSVVLGRIRGDDYLHEGLHGFQHEEFSDLESKAPRPKGKSLVWYRLKVVGAFVLLFQVLYVYVTAVFGRAAVRSRDSLGGSREQDGVVAALENFQQERDIPLHAPDAFPKQQPERRAKAMGLLTSAGNDVLMEDGKEMGGKIGDFKNEPASDSINDSTPQAPNVEGKDTQEEAKGNTVSIPPNYEKSYGNVWDEMQEEHRPMFWHIPKNGGTTVEDILAHCIGLVGASQIGATEGHGEENALEVNSYNDKGRYVNVDTTTLPGIQRAKRLNLIPSGLADVIVSHRFHGVTTLFDELHKGRAFAMFRHPVKRAVSMFFYLQRATWEPTYDPGLANMTLEEYATSDRAEENWVVRSLTNEFQLKVTRGHVEMSKEILRQKVLVGLQESFEESLVRFEKYFGWWTDVTESDRKTNCQRRKVQRGVNRAGAAHPIVEEGTAAFVTLSKRNWADMELYQYAMTLFREQAALL